MFPALDNTDHHLPYVVGQMRSADPTRDELSSKIFRLLDNYYRNLGSTAYSGSNMLQMRPSTASQIAFLPSIQSELGQPSSALKAIERLRGFERFGENWDAEGALAPDVEALDAAVLLVGFLKPLGLKTSAALDALGRPMIFLEGTGVEGEITVESPGSLSFAFFGPGDDVFGESGFDRETLPDELASSLEAVGMI